MKQSNNETMQTLKMCTYRCLVTIAMALTIAPLQTSTSTSTHIKINTQHQHQHQHMMSIRIKHNKTQQHKNEQNEQNEHQATSNEHEATTNNRRAKNTRKPRKHLRAVLSIFVRTKFISVRKPGSRSSRSHTSLQQQRTTRTHEKRTHNSTRVRTRTLVRRKNETTSRREKQTERSTDALQIGGLVRKIDGRFASQHLQPHTTTQQTTNNKPNKKMRKRVDHSQQVETYKQSTLSDRKATVQSLSRKCAPSGSIDSARKLPNLFNCSQHSK